MHYLVELILWLLLAFFIGAIIACLLRGLFGAGTGEGMLGAPGSGVSKKTAAGAGAAAAGAAGAAGLMSGKADDKAAERAAAEKAAAEKAAAEKAAAEKAAAEKAAAEKAAAEKAAAEKAAAEKAAAEKAAAEKAAAEKAAAEKAAAEKAAAEKAAAEKAAAEKAAAEKAAAEKAAAEKPQAYGLSGPIGGKADNLTRIKGIGSKINGILNDLGIYHFKQIATWTEKEIEWVDERLKFKGRIEREDWVAQAKLLAEGKETEFSKRVDKGEVATSHTHTTKAPGEK